MTCSCGTKQCYICRQVITGYDHFNDRGPCRLWDDTVARNAEDVIKAAADAQEEVKRSNQNLDADQLAMLDQERAKLEADIKKKGTGPHAAMYAAMAAQQLQHLNPAAAQVVHQANAARQAQVQQQAAARRLQQAQANQQAVRAAQAQASRVTRDRIQAVRKSLGNGAPTAAQLQLDEIAALQRQLDERAVAERWNKIKRKSENRQLRQQIDIIARQAVEQQRRQQPVHAPPAAPVVPAPPVAQTAFEHVDTRPAAQPPKRRRVNVNAADAPVAPRVTIDLLQDDGEDDQPAPRRKRRAAAITADARRKSPRKLDVIDLSNDPK